MRFTAEEINCLIGVLALLVAIVGVVHQVGKQQFIRSLVAIALACSALVFVVVAMYSTFRERQGSPSAVAQAAPTAPTPEVAPAPVSPVPEVAVTQAAPSAPAPEVAIAGSVVPGPPTTTEQKSWTNSLGMTMVRIEPGTFMMGSPDTDEDADDDEKPAHEVQITRPYYISMHEVAQGQYQAVMGTNPSSFKGSDDLPVESVSWEDAQAFCTKLTAKEGGRVRYRLPTEAEWEHACRAGSTSKYLIGDDDAALDQYAWYAVNSGHRTHPVGQLRPNVWDLYDMIGNVWEWCADGFDEKAYKTYDLGRAVRDPVGPALASYRALRGGGWDNAPRSCRPAYRDKNAPGYRNLRVGFRLAAVQE